jgi:hypothetical protein
MTAPVAIDVALRDPNLLGAALGDASTWAVWIAIVKAAYGRPLNSHERELFTLVAGNREPPTCKVKELICVASRRSGKGRIGAACAIHAALLTDHSAVLAPGETGVVACVSPTRAQATILLDYAVGYLDASPLLRDEVADVTADEIRLKNGNVICTLTSDYRSLRGRTLLLAIMDEASFLRDEQSSTPDIECARALLPGLATTNGMLAILSSPYRRLGLLYQRHRDHFGQNGDVLVIQAPSHLLNPTLDAALIEAHRAADPEASLAEWDAQFRSDLVAFLSEDLIELATDYARPPELPPQQGLEYKSFADPSGGRHDSFTICVGHKDSSDRFVCDVLRGKEPPFDPQEVTREYAALAREYRCSRIYGDNFSADWVVSAFAECDVSYLRMEKNKSEIYLEGLPFFSRGLVMLPEHRRLGRELRLLERHVSRAGRDRVDHGRNGSDDYCNVVFGCLHLVVQRPSYELPGFVGVGADGSIWMSGGSGGDDIDEAERERAAAEAEQRFQSERYRNHILTTGGYWNAPLWRR